MAQDANAATDTTRKPRWRRVRKAILVTVVLAMAAYLLLAWIEGLRREIFVVNGLHRPYTLRLQGRDYSLAPQEPIRVRTGEGVLAFEITGLDVPPVAGTVNCHSYLFTRPFERETFVLNPDGAAVLRQVRTFYSDENAPDDSRPEVSYLAGETLHRLSGIDYPFVPVPERITMSRTSQRVAREALAVVTPPANVAPATFLLLLAEVTGAEQAVISARQHLQLEPQRTEYLAVIDQLMEPQVRVELLRGGLDRRPVQIMWHRSYQAAMIGCGKGEEVEREYEAMLSREPANKDLIYLAARVSLNLDKRLARYEQAATGEAACPFAVFAMCGRHLAAGQFAEAAQDADRVGAALSKEADLLWYTRQAYLACGQEGRFLELAKADEAKPRPLCFRAFVEQAYVNAILGRREQARQMVDALRQHLTEWDAGSVDPQIARLNAQLAYAGGDVGEFVRVMKDSEDPEDQLVANLTRGDIGAAEEQFDSRHADSEQHLLAYITAKNLRREDVASRHLETAIRILRDGDFDERSYSAALAGQSTLNPADLLRLPYQLSRKLVVLVALGLRDPEHRAEYFELARKLNFDRRFPHLLIKQIVSSQPSP